MDNSKSLITDEMNEAIERMDEIGHCWQLITDMACPTGLEGDLNAVNRDGMATALNFLQKEYWLASERLQLEMQDKLSSNRRLNR